MKLCLVINNSSVVRKVAKSILESIGYIVIEADNGQEALEKCQLGVPDAILVDQDLPILSGQDFLMMFARTIKGRKPYIVYSTMEYDPFDITRAISMGADDFVLKPFERDDLLAKFGGQSRAA